MRKITSIVAALPIVLILGVAPPAVAQFYTQHNLVSDGAVPAECLDPNLVNAWGLAASPTSPWWVSDNGTGKASLYRVDLIAPPPPALHCPSTFTAFTVPGAAGPSAPTGMVRNGGTGFVVNNGGTGSPSSAAFIMASEDGTISAFRGNPIVVVVNKSASGAVYKGLAIATGTATGDFLYATNFSAGTVDVFNSTFAQVNSALPPDAFTDPDLPPGYAPFGIQNVNGVIYVTYALQDALKHDDVPGKGHGFVDAFDTAGKLLRRVASGGKLDSPWGIAPAPPDFGFFSGDLLIGNFGDGKINAFDPGKQEHNGEYQERGELHSADGPPLVIEGLWALEFGTGSPASGPRNVLFFTAGPDDEQHGLFGSLAEAPSPKAKDKDK
jgi:uncharacterized protein (TIGR03118 family)